MRLVLWKQVYSTGSLFHWDQTDQIDQTDAINKIIDRCLLMGDPKVSSKSCRSFEKNVILKM
jgi:hypothetical protein